MNSSKLRLVLTFLWTIVFTFPGYNQCTPGAVTLIDNTSPYYSILDPNADGYITASGGPFTSGTTEMAEFEAIPNSVTGWVEITDVSETHSDITPNCGNPDLVTDDNGGDFAFYNIIDATPASPTSGDEYMLIRFRLAKSPNGNFGYNFLFDTDLTYGIGRDPNNICGNRGFEREVQFANAGNKKGVSVYDVDGSTSMSPTTPPCSACISIDDVMEACAASSGGCSTTDPQFITFPVPMSYLGLGSDTNPSSLYISAATANSGNATSVLGGGNVTDMGAIEGDVTGCPACNSLTGCNLFDCQTDCVYAAFSTLPVELIYFKVDYKIGNAIVKWATASEQNNSHFEVQNSYNGNDFTTIGTVRANQNSTAVQFYEFVHTNPVKTTNYYRLKQLDIDGSFAYSTIEVLKLAEEVAVIIQPTIARDVVRLNIFGRQDGGIVRVFNLMKVQVGEIALERNADSIEIPVSHLPVGHYFVQVQMGAQIVTQQFIKAGH